MAFNIIVATSHNVKLFYFDCKLFISHFFIRVIGIHNCNYSMNYLQQTEIELSFAHIHVQFIHVFM